MAHLPPITSPVRHKRQHKSRLTMASPRRVHLDDSQRPPHSQDIFPQVTPRRLKEAGSAGSRPKKRGEVTRGSVVEAWCSACMSVETGNQVLLDQIIGVALDKCGWTTERSLGGVPPPAPSLEENCAVCMRNMDRPSSLPCGHAFCLGCIFGWLHQKMTCPLCRATTDPCALRRCWASSTGRVAAPVSTPFPQFRGAAFFSVQTKNGSQGVHQWLVEFGGPDLEVCASSARGVLRLRLVELGSNPCSEMLTALSAVQPQYRDTSLLRFDAMYSQSERLLKFLYIEHASGPKVADFYGFDSARQDYP